MSQNSQNHILIVEDEQHLAIGIKFNLEEEGYRVTTVADGLAALAVFEADPFAIDLVVLDLMLPGLSGYAVCETLRDQGHDVPVLMLSARTLTEDRIRGQEAGADQYLQKPFDLDELLAMVRNLLARRSRLPLKPGKAPDTFEFGKVHVNFDTYEVTSGGQPVRLTSLDMKLLRYFIENEGSVLSRSQLLENVWNQPSSINTRTVDNFVSRLRRYFEDDPSQPRHFLSVRGAGYRFVSSPEAGIG